MPWFQVDDQFWSHHKFLCVDFAARGLWVSAGSWCAQNLTDGWLPDAVVPMVAMGRDVALLAAELEAAGLWIRGVGGWQFKDWTDWNRPREWHEEQREHNRRRQREFAERKRQQRAQTNAVANAVPNALDDALLTLPNPTQPSTGSSVVGKAEVVSGSDRSAIANRERFEQFWNIAIRKTGKGHALKAFTRALTRTSEHHLAAAWIAANRAWATWPDRRLIPHPATWLNQDRWDDDPPTPHQPTTTSSKTLTALAEADRMEGTDHDPSRHAALAHPRSGLRPHRPAIGP